ncbi:glycerophosphodiester phosphodiesterase family protein [Dinoroseobacter sp. S124A]|uniref:glycerophosphodiester phosphodiesterase family protein n=1 Tax=Dinoroseobacter sp. S124A TaxID=3415128 RepID=UPI003C798325
MNVLPAYRDAWTNRGFVIPVVLGVRLLSLAVIAPLLGLAVQLAILVSGQSALTDQDIAYFILSPLGFPLFLAVAGLVLVGTVIGFAAITLDLRSPDRLGVRAIPRALRQVVVLFPRLMRYAAELVLRVLLITGPFALVGVLSTQHLLGAYDINFYLTEHPPEFVKAVAIGVGLAIIAVPLLLSQLLAWALSLHFVLFGGATAHASFGLSRAAMRGRKLALLTNLAIWYGIRTALVLAVGALFVGLLQLGAQMPGGAFELRLALALVLTSLWAVAGFVVAAISIGALARILGRSYEGPMTTPEPPAQIPGLLSPRRLALAAAALVVIGLSSAYALIAQVQNEGPVEVIAHRGAAGAFPENTLASIRGALEAGADWVEIDVQESADGTVIVMHDSDFMKLSAVNLKVWDATAEDLAGIDIGSWFDPSFADARVPTLAEVLEVVRDRAHLLIELKYYGHDEALEARTVDLVEAAGMADQVATMSLKYPAVTKMKALRPDWPSGVLAATAIGNLARLEGEFVAVNSALVTPRLLRQAHGAGKQVFAWTVNDPLEMLSLMSLGVDGLITDEPALAREVIAQRDELTPHERMVLVFLERFGLSQSIETGRDNSP